MKQLLVLAVCLSVTDLKHEGCRVLCVRDGYTSGHYAKGGCQCVDAKPNYSDFINRRMSLGTGKMTVVVPRPDSEELEE